MNKTEVFVLPICTLVLPFTELVVFLSLIKFVNIFQFNSMLSSVQIQPNNFDLAVKSDKNNKFDKVN